MQTERLIAEVMKRPAIWQSKLPQHKFKNVTKRLWDEITQLFPGMEVDELKKKWKNLKDTYRREFKKYLKFSSRDATSDYQSQWKYFDMLQFLADENMPKEFAEGDSMPIEFIGNEYTTTEEGSDLTSELKLITESIDIKEEQLSSPLSQCSTDQMSSSSPQPSTSEPAQKPFAQTEKPSQKRPTCTPNQLSSEYLAIEKMKLKLLEHEIAKRCQQDKEIKSDDYYFLMSLLPEMEKLNVMQKMRLRNKINQALMDEIALSENSFGYHTQPHAKSISAANVSSKQYKFTDLTQKLKRPKIKKRKIQNS